jgi:hypothetical protein
MKVLSPEYLIDSGVLILHVPELVEELDLDCRLHLKMRDYTMVNSKHGDALGMAHILLSRFRAIHGKALSSDLFL